MKKLFKRIAVLLCIVTLFNIPTTALAASAPVLTFNDSGFIVYEYQPEPYYLPIKGIYDFMNYGVTSDGQWKVPAGNPFHFFFSYEESTMDVRVLIRRFTSPNTATIVYDEIVSSNLSGIQIDIPAHSENTSYFVTIVAYKAINLTAYTAYSGG